MWRTGSCRPVGARFAPTRRLSIFVVQYRGNFLGRLHGRAVGQHQLTCAREQAPPYPTLPYPTLPYPTLQTTSPPRDSKRYARHLFLRQTGPGRTLPRIRRFPRLSSPAAMGSRTTWILLRRRLCERRRMCDPSGALSRTSTGGIGRRATLRRASFPRLRTWVSSC